LCIALYGLLLLKY